ncbi:MAG: phospho-sugar mutase [Clostridia bacterium]|nr:phospho-sugar mutase [Clostridia bacterium]
MAKTYLDEYEKWRNSGKLTADELAEISALADDRDELILRFGAPMTFGTAGLRATMKTGLGCMNVYTVAHATQGMAALVLREGRADDGVVIAYDSRLNSRLFAETAACVLAANGIRTYLFDDIRPTPELSFAVRALGCAAGINITASHNPKAYNGYKAYWEDGAQLAPEYAAVVAEAIAAVDIFTGVKRIERDALAAHPLVTVIGAEFDERYLEAVLAQRVNPNAIPAVADDLRIVYTPLHGAGTRLVPEVLRRAGLKHIFPVLEQSVPDGNFPTVAKPNPEYADVFALGAAIAEREQSDLVIATDPDADRVGVITRTPDGSFTTISGNSMGALLLDYIITAYRETGTMPPQPYAVKSIVTTELAAKICAAGGVVMHNVLTGFKFIGEVIKQHETRGEGSFLFGFEESYGYLKGTYARDKDAVLASMLICEMTAYYKAKSMTLYDALTALHTRYGFHAEKNTEIIIAGVDGAQKMRAMLDALRRNPPAAFAGRRVVRIGDYRAQTFTHLPGGQTEPTGLPAADVLYYALEGGDTIVVRPSGTEPKVKFYYMMSGKDAAETDAKFGAYSAAVNELLG